MSEADSAQPRVATGVDGLDRILGGGLLGGEFYLIQGGPGTGKTTLGLQFLLDGIGSGERVLYLSLSQTEGVLERIAASHGWSVANVHIHGFTAGELTAVRESQQTLFHSVDVELGETTREIREAIERFGPDRVVFDSVNVISMLAGSRFRYWQEILSLRHFLADKRCTVLLLDDEPLQVAGGSLQALVHGLIELEQASPDYGDVRRRLRVVKFRGSSFHTGFHNFKIRTGGLEVFPRLQTKGVRQNAGWEVVESGVPKLDDLLGGGMTEGTACVLLGPTGTGKSSVASLYAYRAAIEGEHAAIFLFDERAATFYRRSKGLGMDFESLVGDGSVSLQQVDTGELSPGEFAAGIRELVEERDSKVVVLDSLTGYFEAMPESQQLVAQMHELLRYLSGHGVLSLLVMGQQGIAGTRLHGNVDISYLADTVLLLRHFESAGRLRKAISVVKMRYGSHETSIRELRMTSKGISVGEPMTSFSGVLSGSPTFSGDPQELMDLSIDDDQG